MSKKDKLSWRNVDDDSVLPTAEIQGGQEWSSPNVQFQDFLRTTQLTGTEFQPDDLNISCVNPLMYVELLCATEERLLERKHIDKEDLLKIPRRPKWSATMSAENFQEAENSAFLKWKEYLALLGEEDDILLTPYEKNFKVWGKLWRCVERSDVIVQIVDARSPLLLRSKDLEICEGSE